MTALTVRTDLCQTTYLPFAQTYVTFVCPFSPNYTEIPLVTSSNRANVILRRIQSNSEELKAVKRSREKNGDNRNLKSSC